MTPSPSSELSKAELRKALIASRRALNPVRRTDATRRAIRHIERLPQFKAGARIAVYESFGSELDTRQLIRSARRRGVRIYVPRVIHFKRRQMLFVPLDANPLARPAAKPLRTGQRESISARWLDLIVVPIVGIDARGTRLGMGAGFFDRALSYRRLRRHWRVPRLVALGFDFQRIASIEAEVWDARLDALATESGLEFFSAD